MAAIPNWRDRATAWMLAAGVVSLCVGAGTYLVTGLLDRASAIFLALGLVLVAWYVVEDYQSVLQALKGRGARYGGNTAAMVLIFVGIVAMLNFLSVRHSWRYDLTATREFSLSEQTVKVLKNLKEPVGIKAFFSEEDYGRSQAQDLLKEFQRQSDQIHFEFVDWVARPGDALAYKLQSFPVMVLESGGRRQDISGFSEQDLTSGVFKVSSGEAKKLLFSIGHGEPDIAAMTETGFGEARQALEASNYVVETINLATTATIGDDVGGIVINAPKTALLHEEQQALKSYLDRGGKVMLLVAPRRTADLSDLLAPFGLGVADGFAIDLQALVNQPYVPVVRSFPDYSPITRDVQASNQAVLLPMATQIVVAPQLPQGVETQRLLASSERSWIAKDERDINYREGDTRGPLTLAVAAAKPVQQSDQAAEQAAQKARLVVFGSADFASNMAIGALANQQLFVNAVNWLTEEEDLIGIRPQAPVDRSLRLTATQANLMIYSSIIFLPALVAAAGFFVWWRRR